MKKFSIASLVVAALCLVASPVVAGEWSRDLRRAYKVAVKQKRRLAIYIENPGCHKCREMMKNTLNDRYVKHHMRSMIKAKIDFRKNTKVAEMMKIGEVPALVVLAPSGKELGRIEGLMKVKKFRQELAKISKKKK